MTSAGHDVDTVIDENLVSAPDRDVVAAATSAERILVSLDRGLGDIRAYPPGSHAGIVVLRLTDQSAASAIKAVSLQERVGVGLTRLTDLHHQEFATGRMSDCYH